MANDLRVVLLFDVTCVITAIFLLFRYGRISFMHPATTYIAFHVIECTQRLVQLVLGAPASAELSKQPLTLAEMTKGVVCFEVALAAVVTASLIVAYTDLRARGPLPPPAQTPPPNISPRYFIIAAAVMIPFGIFGLYRDLSAAHGYDSGEVVNTANQFIHTDWSNSFATTMIGCWLGLAFLPLFYLYGPKKILLVVFTAACLGYALTGIARWRYELPIIFVCAAYLARTGKAWPPAILIVFLVLVGALFLPSKTIGTAIISGKYPDVGSAITAGYNQWSIAATNSSQEDTQFLDVTSGFIANTDHFERYLYGETITDSLYQFIPRPLWKNKPYSAQWQIEMCTPGRPLADFGSVPSMPGCAYMDFGFIGVFVEIFAFMYVLAIMYFRAFRQNYYSVQRFFYLIICCTLIQIYRDGIMSFFVFDFINCWPLTAIVIVHFFFPVKRVIRNPNQIARQRVYMPVYKP